MLLSPEPKIDNLQFHAMPTQPIHVTHAVRSGSTIVCLGANGKLYTDARLAGNYAYTLGVWPWLEDTLKALVKLGVVTSEQYQIHMRAAESAQDGRDRQYAREDIARFERKYGFKLTAEQRKAITGPKKAKKRKRA